MWHSLLMIRPRDAIQINLSLGSFQLSGRIEALSDINKDKYRAAPLTKVISFGSKQVHPALRDILIQCNWPYPGFTMAVYSAVSLAGIIFPLFAWKDITSSYKVLFRHCSFPHWNRHKTCPNLNYRHTIFGGTEGLQQTRQTISAPAIYINPSCI